jgi:hypothetical protein
MTTRLLFPTSTNVSSLLSTVKNKVTKSITKFKFNEKWKDRNKQYGDIYTQLLEVDALCIQGFIFVEATPEIVAKLDNLGFTLVEGFAHEQIIKKFSCTVYNEKYNVAISLYNTETKSAILTAHKIVNDSLLEVMVKNPVVSLFVFSTAVTQLMEDT